MDYTIFRFTIYGVWMVASLSTGKLTFHNKGTWLGKGVFEKKVNVPNLVDDYFYFHV
jgi:hypothetical protein